MIIYYIKALVICNYGPQSTGEQQGLTFRLAIPCYNPHTAGQQAGKTMAVPCCLQLQKLGQKRKSIFILTLGILLSYMTSIMKNKFACLALFISFFQVLSTCNGYYKFSSWTNKKKMLFLV